MPSSKTGYRPGRFYISMEPGLTAAFPEEAHEFEPESARRIIH